MALVIISLFGFLFWLISLQPYEPNPRWTVIRQCRGGGAWLSRSDRGELRMSNGWTGGGVLPENADAACPK